MDAPEVVSGPERSLSHKLRSQPRLQIPPPVHSPVQSSGESTYGFSPTSGSDEKERIPLPVRPQRTTIWSFRRRRIVLILALIILGLVATIGGGVGGSLAAANARRYDAYQRVVAALLVQKISVLTYRNQSV